MPTERKRVNLSVTPSRVRNILKFGSEQGMRGSAPDASGRLPIYQFNPYEYHHLHTRFIQRSES